MGCGLSSHARHAPVEYCTNQPDGHTIRRLRLHLSQPVLLSKIRQFGFTLAMRQVALQDTIGARPRYRTLKAASSSPTSNAYCMTRSQN